MRALLTGLVSVWACCGFILSTRGQTYYFTTIAGQAGITGTADGTNNQALFNRPSELVLDEAGALYVSDTLNETIRKITSVGADWVVTTVAGTPGTSGSLDGTNSAAQFNRPNGLAFDAAGNLFVADHYNHTIRKITRDGTNYAVSTIAGLALVSGTENGTNSDARFQIPTGIATDASGRVFVADTANYTIRMATPVGTNWVVSTIAGTADNFGFIDGLDGMAAFGSPYGMARGPDGAFYVADAGNNAIRQITEVSKGWDTTTIANSPPHGDTGSRDGPARQATFNNPNGIVLDTATNIYVADQRNHTIRKLSYSGRTWDVTTIGGQPGTYGSSDGLGTNALFWMPWGVAVDTAGAIYVADAYNHTIRRGVPAITLNIAAYGPGVVLSWPAAPDRFKLEKNTSLSAPLLWEAVTNGIVLAGDHYVLTNIISNQAVFFRLKR